MLAPVTLRGELVACEPLRPAHAEALAAAAAEDRSSYAHTWVPDGIDEAVSYVFAALRDHARGDTVPFVVRRLADDRVVGSTRYLDCQVFRWPAGRGPAVPADAWPSVTEVGNTWYAASAQRTAVNTECKLLLLGYAFEVWQVHRVSLKTDARNLRSREAIERVGALFEGVRRCHGPAPDGTVRDTAYYSVVREEWPSTRERLTRALGRS
jgi:RimJ/RimL family protein N-acetyltransferase